MKSKLFKCAPLLCLLSAGTERGFGQGFINLNFESANIPSGTKPGDFLPAASALPGWTPFYLGASFGSNATTQVWYDGWSTGGTGISIIDGNGYTPNPLQGKFSVFLFGSEGVSAGISQTGLVPAGTQSLLCQVSYNALQFVAIVGGQTINMVPVATFPDYTMYGGDISAFAGQVETVSFIEPPEPPGTVPPSELLLDSILFSRLPVPEPGTLALVGAGAMLFGLKRWRKGLP
jgi:hypothetical protein